MQTLQLYNLALDQTYKVRKKGSLKGCMVRSDTEDELYGYLTGIIHELEYAMIDTWQDNKKVDIEVERGLKHALYRLDKLFDEIKGFKKEGYHPNSIKESFVRSGCDELELIMEELKPYSGDHHWLVTKSVGCREYKEELDKLIELLMNPNVRTPIYIIGEPGVGKSTLLGLACHNDSGIQEYFTRKEYIDLRDGEPYQSLAQVLHSKGAHGEKILFSLDNVRTCTPRKGVMRCVGQESKVVITSRLKPEEICVHLSSTVINLLGLSPSESWNLFKRTAFPDEENLPNILQTTLSDIGRQICIKCKNIPAVIVIIATILSFKTTPEEWKHFLDVVLTSVPDPITTVTYLRHWTQYTQRYIPYIEDFGIDQERGYCLFGWLSMLPKLYIFKKNDLLNLLRPQSMFEGRIEQFNHWFDNLVMNGYIIECDGGIMAVSYKISSLGYDLMKHVARDDYCLVDDPAVEVHHKVIRHLSFLVDASWEPPSWLPHVEFLQSLRFWPRKYGDFISISKINSVLSHLRNLRALHAEVVHCETIPQFLGEFKMLKYLRLGAVSTISLPQDMPVLKKLLNSDPYYSVRIGGKTRAQTILDLLVKFSSKTLTIQPGDNDNVLESLEEGWHFLKLLNVQSITLSSSHGDDEKLRSENLLQAVETLKVHCWTGKKWPTDDKLLSMLTYNLVSIQFENCRRCQHIPDFSNLPHLIFLQLWSMCSLEDILISDEKNEASSTRTFYPSLKVLVLWDLPKFMGWSHEEGYFFPVLEQIKVQGCPKFKSMPSAPMLKSLKAININAELINHLSFLRESSSSSTSSTESRMTNLEIDGCIEFDWANAKFWLALSCLRYLKLNNIMQLVSLPEGLECITTTLGQLSLCWLTNLKALPEWMTKLRRLTIHYCLKLTKLPNSFSGLQELDIRYCPRLSRFPESLPNLKRLRVQEFCQFEQILRASQNLQILEINNCQDWDYDTQSTDNNSSLRVWKVLNKLRALRMTNMEAFPKSIDFEQLSNLCHLTITSCPKLTNLPESLCGLTALEYIQIKSCPGLTQLPRTFMNLRSLKYLEIRACPQLERSCDDRDGEDWDLIKHTPYIISGGLIIRREKKDRKIIWDIRKENTPPVSLP